MKRIALIAGLILLVALAACNGLPPQTTNEALVPTEAVATDAAPAEVPTEAAPAEAEVPAEPPAEATPADMPEMPSMVVPVLAGTTWEWVSLTNPTGTVEVADPTRYTVEFLEDGTAAIQADCNRVVASYTADETGALTITPGPSTMAACAADSQDQLFLASLAVAARYFGYETEPSLIIELMADGGQMLFRPAGGASGEVPVEGDVALVAPTWEWVSTIGPTGQTAAVDPTRYTIVFNEDGTVAVRADCNNAFGTYITDGTNLNIELGASTMAACPPDTQDVLFSGGLNGAATYTIQDGELFIEMMADAGTMIFRQAAAVEAPAPGPTTLVGPTWEWVTLVTPVEQIDAADPTRYSITFMEDGTAAIQADCNRVVASYTADEAGALTITLGPSTLAACAPDSQDQVFLGALSNAAIYFIEDGELFIDMAVDSGTLRFRPAAAPTHGEGGQTSVEALTSAVWQWYAVGGPATGIVVEDPSRYEVTFAPDGSLMIQADCNTVLGTYTAADDGSIAIALGPSTLAACPPDSQSTEFLSYLAAASQFAVDLGNLSLTVAEDGTALQLQATGGEQAQGPAKGGGQVAPPMGGDTAGNLTSTLWTWTGYTQGDRTVTVADPSLYTVTFNDDGTAAIQADCNRVVAGYEVAGDMLTITLGPTTAAFCGPNSLDQVFLGGLANSMSYRLEGENLMIDMLFESGTLTFGAAQ